MIKKLLVTIVFGVGVVIAAAPFLVFSQSPPAGRAGADDKRTTLEAQIRAIEEEINVLDGELKAVEAQSKTLQNEIFRLNTEIKRSELTIRGLNLSISETKANIKLKEINIDVTEADAAKQRSALAEYLRTLHKFTDRSLVEILLSKSLAEFFQEVSVLEGLQEDSQIALERLRALKAKLEREKEELAERKEELEGLKALEELQRRNLAGQRQEKDRLLAQTKGQEAAFQRLISAKRRDIAAIRTQIYYLERTGVTAEEAVKFAELASTRAGIRPAFLLGLLEVETGRRFQEGVITAGTHLGSGNWQRDMHPRDHAAYLQITSELGLDPDQMPVSAKPSYGWGGAMGPAQFLPTTWLLYRDRVAKTTGHNPPNPWIVEDAFTAAALYLADAGATAKTPAAETRAAKAYISGSPSCSRYICNFYSREVLRIAALIEPNL